MVLLTTLYIISMNVKVHYIIIAYLPTKLVQGIWKANREGNQGGEHASYLKWVMFVVLVW